MAKQSPNPWLIIFILLLPVLVPLLWVSGSLIVLTIKFMISYGDFTMSKATKSDLPTSPTGVPAQTDPYEYNWQLDVDSATLAYHRGGKKKGVGLGILYVESRNSPHLYSDFYDNKGTWLESLWVLVVRISPLLNVGNCLPRCTLLIIASLKTSFIS